MVLMCCAIFTGNSAVAQNYPMSVPSVDRFYGLSKVWQEVNYNFTAFDRNPTLDWDSLYKTYIPLVIKSTNDYEYYRLLQRFAAHLNDANTNVSMPAAIKDSLVIPPVIIKEIRGRYYITNIDKQLMATIPVGSEVIRINGFEISSYLRNEVLPYISANTDHARMTAALETMLEGWVNTRVLLNCITPDGRNINEMVSRDRSKRVQWIRNLPAKDPIYVELINRDIALVTLNSFSKETVAGFPNNSDLAKARGIIIDLRNNNHREQPGKAASLVIRFSDQEQIILPGFTTRKYPYSYTGIGEGLDRFGKYTPISGYSHQPPDTFMVPPLTEKSTLPLVILTGPKTGNAAEHFLMMLKQSHFRATIIGTRTAGSTGSSITAYLPGDGQLSVNARYDIYPEDTWIFDGVEPDIYVPLDIKSILNGEDLVLLKAVEFFSNPAGK